MRSRRLATLLERAISFGSSGSAARAHSGTAVPAECASQIASPKRSTRRRRGAVTCAYGAPTADCMVSAGCLAVERRVPGTAEQRRRRMQDREMRRIGAVEHPQVVAVGLILGPRGSERARLAPEPVDRVGLRRGHGAQDADPAIQHHGRRGHAGHERQLRVPGLHRQQFAAVEPIPVVQRARRSSTPGSRASRGWRRRARASRATRAWPTSRSIPSRAASGPRFASRSACDDG